MNSTSRDMVDMLQFVALLDDNGRVMTDDLGELVLAQDSTYTYGTNLFISKMPTKPANVVVIYDTPGAGIDLAFDKDNQYQRTDVQIRIRNTNYTNATAVAYDVIQRLQAIAHEVWNDTTYELVGLMNGPALLEYDENNRVVLVLNFNIQRR